MNEAERRATLEFVADLARALEARMEAERRALDFYRAELLDDEEDEAEDEGRTTRVMQLLRSIQRADDAYDRAVADASFAFRKQVEQQYGLAEPPAPAESGEYYARSVLDNAHEAFIAMDAGGFIIDWNPQAERTFGWSREEAVGRVLADTIIPIDYREAHLRGLQRFLDQRTAKVLNRRLELMGMHRDGSEFPVEVTISTIPGTGVPRFCAFVREMGDHELAPPTAAA